MMDLRVSIVLVGYLFGYVDSFLEGIQHEIVRPVIYQNRQRRDTTYTKDGHIRKFSIHLNTSHTSYTIDLERNRLLLSANFKIRTFNSNGSEVITSIEERDNHCHYQGSIRGVPDSVVSVSTCHGISGMILGDDALYIHPIDNTTSGKHAVWKPQDDENHLFGCGTCSEDHVHTMLKRSVKPTAGSVNWPDQHGENSKIVELFLVSDYRHYVKYKNNVTRRALETVNHVNALYSQLGIYVMLVGMEIWNQDDMIAVTSNSSSTLEQFRKYRRQYITPKFPNDNTQLITGMTFEKFVIGKASIGTMCTDTFSCGVNRDHREMSVTVASTMAHEMGHNFGMVHDGPSCKCEGISPCIMSAKSLREQTKWSSCSTETLSKLYKKGGDYCLHNLPDKIYEGPLCGNGVKEPGEECDCGIEKFCTNGCCDPTTCMLTENSTCATGACCDLKTCQMKVATTPCREASGFCDLPEFCTGESEWCPSDVYKYNGMPCDNQGDSYCYKGKCNSHNSQCSMIWGPTAGQAHPYCYKFNTDGRYSGSCGYDPLSKKYTKCKQKDIFCGSLICSPALEETSFWKNIYFFSSLTGSVNTEDGRKDCRGILLDVGRSTPNPSYVLDGTKCETNKVQTDRGTCYCDNGYGPPYCIYPGIGGSVDSGPPAQHGTRDRTGEIVAIVVTLILLLSIPIILCIISKRCPHLLVKCANFARKTPLRRRKPRSHSGSSDKPRLPTDKTTVSAPVLVESSNKHKNNLLGVNGHSAHTITRETVYHEIPSPVERDYSVYENIGFSGEESVLPYHSKSYQVNQERENVSARNGYVPKDNLASQNDGPIVTQLKAALEAMGHLGDQQQKTTAKRFQTTSHSIENSSTVQQPKLSPQRPAPSVPTQPRFPQRSAPTIPPRPHSPVAAEPPQHPPEIIPQRAAPSIPPATSGGQPQSPLTPWVQSITSKNPKGTNMPHPVPGAQRPPVSEKPKLLKKPANKTFKNTNSETVHDNNEDIDRILGRRKFEGEVNIEHGQSEETVQDETRPVFSHLNKKNKPSLPQKPPKA